MERDLVRQVVRIDQPDRAKGEGRIRILTHESMRLQFEGASAEGGNLALASPVPGRCLIPPQALRELTLGDHDVGRYPDRYSSWVIRPADP